MRNKLTDLNDYLFEQLERLNDDDLTAEQLDIQLKKTEAMNKVANNIIHNAELQYKAMMTAAEYGVINQNQVKLLVSDSNEL